MSPGGPTNASLARPSTLRIAVSDAIKLPPWPVFESDEIDAVEDVLRSGRVNYWTGSVCKEFESLWSAAHAGVHTLSMANGSVTLESALRALGIGPGDEVIVSPRSYVASAMCVLLAGATPVFADVDPVSGCITPDTAEAVRSPRTKAIIPVHIGGWPCDMHGFQAWAKPQGIHIIEDCAQAHGAHIDGRPVGTFGVFASWSFCQDKIMTTGGEGGMLCTTDHDLYTKCWSFNQHGKDAYDALLPYKPEVPGSFRWMIKHEGTNLRMTEMQAAIGMRQLSKLPSWSAARRRNSLIMQDALRSVGGLRVPETPDGHAHYRCVAFVEGEEHGASAADLRNDMLRALHEDGVPAMHGSCGEIYREDVFTARNLTPAALGRGTLDSDGRLPNARRLHETCLTFLVHHTIDEASMRAYAGSVARCLRAARV
jgi:dTDP-4-amino-4,6-dideoxygalactose transaminase